MEPDKIPHRDVGCVSSQRIGLRIILSLHLEAVRATADTALHGVMTTIDLNNGDHGYGGRGANPDCSRGDLGAGRTYASA